MIASAATAASFAPRLRQYLQGGINVALCYSEERQAKLREEPWIIEVIDVSGNGQHARAAKGSSGNNRVSLSGMECVVPFAVKHIAINVECGSLFVGDLSTCRI